ncbi:protein of unknown function [Shewanella benthica]|uniref:Uncharacterized protein n=1 Tax=Shewanella benthica TaxID=43661 RepID=A0A330LWR8_9GAMM|nr:protein of unknown function [Shewanella benthica]
MPSNRSTHRKVAIYIKVLSVTSIAQVCITRLIKDLDKYAA